MRMHNAVRIFITGAASLGFEMKNDKTAQKKKEKSAIAVVFLSEASEEAVNVKGCHAK